MAIECNNYIYRKHKKSWRENYHFVHVYNVHYLHKQKKKKIENICYKVDILTSKRPLLLIDIADFLATEIIY